MQPPVLRTYARVPKPQKLLTRSFSRTSHLSKDLLKGKKCIITGASRGIGAEIARRFAAEGAQCLLVGRNEGLLSSVKDEIGIGAELSGHGIESPSGRGHKIVLGDVGKEEFWRNLRGEVCGI